MASCCECVKKDMARASSLYERLRGFPESADKDAPSRGGKYVSMALFLEYRNGFDCLKVNWIAMKPSYSTTN